MNTTQAAAIVVRDILTTNRDKLLELVFETFVNQHGVGIAEKDEHAIREAIIAAQDDLARPLSSTQIQAATLHLTERGWADVHGEELE